MSNILIVSLPINILSVVLRHQNERILKWPLRFLLCPLNFVLMTILLCTVCLVRQYQQLKHASTSCPEKSMWVFIIGMWLFSMFRSESLPVLSLPSMKPWISLGNSLTLAFSQEKNMIFLSMWDSKVVAYKPICPNARSWKYSPAVCPEKKQTNKKNSVGTGEQRMSLHALSLPQLSTRSKSICSPLKSHYSGDRSG